jgi:hypothetical protein
MYPHRIRLRGPWECEPIAPPGGAAPPARRVTMPSGWIAAGLTEFRGQARFIRRFGYPGRIDDGEHVWLLGDGARGCISVCLNGRLLGDNPSETFAFDVTAILSQRNVLEVMVQGDADEVGLWGDIVLDIRRDAYLADVAVQRAGAGLIVSGKVVGIAPQALELYTLVDNRHADYRTIMPTTDGEPFHIELADVDAASQTVRVELICVSSIWYVVEAPIPG